MSGDATASVRVAPTTRVWHLPACSMLCSLTARLWLGISKLIGGGVTGVESG